MAEDILGTSNPVVFCEGFFYSSPLVRQRTVPCFQMLGDLPVLSVSAITAGKVLIGVKLLVENTSYV